MAEWVWVRDYGVYVYMQCGHAWGLHYVVWGVYMHAVYSVGVYSACGVHVCIYVQCACMVYVLCDIIVMSKLYIDLFIIEQEMGFC